MLVCSTVLHYTPSNVAHRWLLTCSILFGELQLGQHLQLLRRMFSGGAGDFLDAFTSRLMAAAAAPSGLTAAAVDAALEDAIQVLFHD
jgi:hypothetical protein